MITFYKDGSGIHIKKSHKGKFTEYCGGKVTEECIRRGKKSPDPQIRKQATFAKNARVFKHQGGGSTGPDIKQNQMNNIYGGKGPISDSNYTDTYNQQMQANQEAFNTQQTNWFDQKQQEQLEQQNKINQINNVADTIGGIVQKYVPTQGERDQNKINDLYSEYGITDEMRQKAYSEGKTDEDIINNIIRTEENHAFVDHAPKYLQNGMLDFQNKRRNALNAEQIQQFTTAIKKNFKGGTLKLKTYYYG